MSIARWNLKEGACAGELQKRRVEGGTHAEPYPDKQRNSTSWLYRHDVLFQASERKVRNCRVPNGTHGGVRDRAVYFEVPPTRFLPMRIGEAFPRGKDHLPSDTML